MNPVEPVRSHRMPLLPRSATFRRWFAWVAVLLAVLIGYAITALTPGEATEQRAFVSTGAMYQLVQTDPFEATVTGVRGASVVEVDSKKYTTSGVWVVVTMRLKAHGGKPIRVSYAGLRDAAGRKYEQPSRFLAPAYGCELEPGIPVTADFIFEVPATVATGLSVEVAPGLDQRMGAMVRITIPQSAATVLTWQQNSTPLQVGAPKLAS
jgi:hypothetical protein